MQGLQFYVLKFFPLSKRIFEGFELVEYVPYLDDTHGNIVSEFHHDHHCHHQELHDIIGNINGVIMFGDVTDGPPIF